MDGGGEVVRRKFAEVPRSRSIAIGGPEWQVGWHARATQNFEPANFSNLNLDTFTRHPPHHRQLSEAWSILIYLDLSPC